MFKTVSGIGCFISMKNTTWIPTAFAALVLTIGALSGNAQTIDTDKSRVSFKIKNLLVNTVNGSFTGMKGDVNFNPDKLDAAYFNVCVDASTIETGIDKRDEHLKTADFFDVAQFPTICFQSKAVSKLDSTYRTTGTLTMHGVEKTVEIPFTFDGKTLIGSLTLNRLDYNVGTDVGSFTADETVNLTIVTTLN